MSAPTLSPAQRRVFDELVRTGSYRAIATRLWLSKETVHSHCKAIYRAYGVANRNELIAKVGEQE